MRSARARPLRARGTYASARGASRSPTGRRWRQRSWGSLRALVGLAAPLAVDRLHLADAWLGETEEPRPLRLARAQAVPAVRRREELTEGALVDDASLADDRHAVAQLLDLAEQVTREQ